MKPPDSQSLVETYHRMSDGELLQLAADVEWLTDAARAALEVELRARKLDPATQRETVTTPPSPPEEPAPARSAVKRTAAITTTGIILLLFSALELFILASSPVTLWSRLPHYAWPLILRLINLEATAVLALWGIATAIGILRLRPWARVSGALICSLGAYGGCAVVIGGLMMGSSMLEMFGRDAAITAMGTGLTFLGLGCLGALGLSVLSSEGARQQFGGATPIPAGARPLSVSCIGLFLVAAWPLALALNRANIRVAVLSLPSVPFASFLSGWAMIVYQYLIAAVAVALGVGILRMWSRARIGVLGLCAAGVLSALSLPLKPNITAVGAIVSGYSISRPGVAAFSLWEAAPFFFAAWLLLKRWPHAGPGIVITHAESEALPGFPAARE